MIQRSCGWTTLPTALVHGLTRRSEHSRGGEKEVDEVAAAYEGEGAADAVLRLAGVHSQE